MKQAFEAKTRSIAIDANLDPASIERLVSANLKMFEIMASTLRNEIVSETADA